MKKAGKVYLVGAGPGDPGLITERGRALLAAADVVLYDHLANRALLLLAKRGAELLCVGKRGGIGGMSQARINALLVRHARRGKLVVRLKGGDPMLFGRGAEEALHLAAARVRFEIVPGVSAALAVPACAGIPLTMRGVSSSVTVLTGREAEGEAGGGVDWGRLLRADSTFVVLMGMGNLEDIAASFLAAGKSPRLPAALVERGTTPRQRTIIGTIGTIARLARRRGSAPPAVLIVGRSVALHRKLAVKTAPPLSGAGVLVTRPAGQTENLAGMLERRGAVPFVCPLIEIRPPKSLAALDRAILSLAAYDWIVFTSVNAVRAFMDRLRALRRDARAFAGMKICAIGPATRAEIGRFGLRADCMPPRFTSEGIVRALGAQGSVRGASFILHRSDRAGDELPNALRRMGGRCDEAVSYRTALSPEGMRRAAALIRCGEIDVALLTSPSVVEAYAKVLEELRRRGVRPPRCVAIGPVTARAAGRARLKASAVGAVHTDEGLVDALVTLMREGKRKGGRP